MELIYGAIFALCTLAAISTWNYEDYIRANGVLHRDEIGYIGATGQDHANPDCHNPGTLS